MSEPDRRMEMLRQRFHQRAASDSVEIQAALQRRDYPRLLHLAHGLAGIAAIFGYAEVSARASALEDGVEGGLEYPTIAKLSAALIVALERVDSL